MNTVGKPGKLGEHVRCVVSVSMLTEGWDANTVTHILGVRAFGTQLLCEQVVGRALRRMSYAANDDGHVRARVRRGLRRAVLLHPRCRDGGAPKPPKPVPTRVRALPEPHRLRDHLPAPRRLPLRDARRASSTATFTDDRELALSTDATSRPRPRSPRSSARSSVHDLDDLTQRGCNEVAFRLAKRTAGELLPRRRRATTQPWLFPQLAGDRQALARRVRDLQGRHVPAAAPASPSTPTTPPSGSTTRSSRRPRATTAARSRSCAPTTPIGSTRYVDFDTTKARLRDPRRQVPRLSHVVADTELGAEDGPGARRHGRGRRATSRTRASASRSPTRSTAEERQLHPRLHRLRRRRPRHGRPAQPDRRSDRRGEEGQGRRRSRPPETCGCPRSTTTAASGAGPSSRSPTRGTPSV